MYVCCLGIAVFNGTLPECGKFFINYYCECTEKLITFFIPGFSSTEDVFLYFAASVVIVVAIIRLLFELFQFLTLKLYYLIDWVNWIEVILFICSIIFVFVYPTGCLCPTPWQWQIGCVAVFLTWIDLIIFIRKIPLTGLL